MARITVEDCLQEVGSRFELVILAARRTRQLLKGSRALVDNTFSQNRLCVLSLREVAAGFVKGRKNNQNTPSS